MGSHQRRRGSDAPGVSTGVAPTPPTSQVRQQSKRRREAEDLYSWGTEAPSAKRRVGISHPGADGNRPSASAHQQHSVADLPLVDDASETYSDAELDQLFTALDGLPTPSYPEMSIDDLLDETLFLEDLEGDETLLRQASPLGAEIQPRSLDCTSVSADGSDRDLQFSSTRASSTLAAVSEGESLLLTQDKGIAQNTKLLEHDTTSTGPCSAGQEQSTSAKRVDHTVMPTPAASAPARHGGNEVFKAFKTFFHLREMLDAKAHMFKNQSEIIFDLFARVVYSVRENYVRKQYFQFRDLFKETPPYLGGALLS